jgi:ribosomal protein L11 methyltransferase
VENRPVPLDLTVLDEERVELLLAAIDDERPTAVEERPSGVRVYFESAAARDRAAAIVAATDPDALATPVDLPDEDWDWAARSQADLEPVQVGRIRVTPVYGDDAMRPAATGGSAPSLDEDVIDIAIVPSMGFGTGHHPTTRRCLALLQETAVKDRTALDVGTGSGVLALAAWKLGAASVLATDCDGDALAAARANVALNRAAGAVQLLQWDLERDAPPEAARAIEVVLANLTGAQIVRAAGRLRRALGPAGGTLIVSGFEVEDEPEVAAALAAAGCTIDARSEEARWVGLLARVGSPAPALP